MNGIEYSALANLIGHQWKKRNTDESKKNTPNQNVNSINSDYSTDGGVENASSNLNQNSRLTSSPKTVLMHRLQSMVDPPEYLNSSLIYKNCSLNTKRGEKSIVGCRDYTDDFILVSEFSEIEGPRPLLTIPADGATGFNKNEYSLHLMCVDFHSHLNHTNGLNSSNTTAINSDCLNESSLSTPLASSSKFGLTKDTTIINYWDLNARMVCACVQHYNLYDLEARG